MLTAIRSAPSDKLTTLCAFVNAGQRQALYAGLRGEERAYFVDAIARLCATIDAMPVTYGQDGNPDPTAHLHYFTAGADWYITEKDSDPDGQGQIQAFGLADIFGDGGEMGYISIPELLANHAEINLHFTPAPLSQVRSTYIAFRALCDAARREA